MCVPYYTYRFQNLKFNLFSAGSAVLHQYCALRYLRYDNVTFRRQAQTFRTK